MLFKQPPVFILSAPKSGSTLLNVSLGRHPDIVNTPELGFFAFKAEHQKYDLNDAQQKENIIDNWINDSRNKVRIDHALWKKKLKEATDWREFLEITVQQYFYSKNITMNSQTIWCEKTPHHIFYQQDILKMYPRARFIYLVREPKAVVASQVRRWWSTHNIVSLAKRWKKTVHRMNRKENALLVKFEDIIEQPEQVYQRICKFLGCEYKPYFYRKKTGKAITAEHLKRFKAGEPVNEKNVKSWEHTLSKFDGEAHIIDRICQKEMKKLGYPPSDQKKPGKYYINYFHYTLGYWMEQLVYMFK